MNLRGTFASVEGVSDQPMLGLALRAAVRPVTIGVGNLFGILLDGAGEGV